jgi:putative PIN family toxin of toxin-antitoxin system
VRAVLDPNVLIAALLSANGTPARIVRGWLAGRFELVASDTLLEELARALAYPKIAARIQPDEAAAFVLLLRRGATLVADPDAPPARSEDPADDYLLALAEHARAVLVSGDRHLLELAATYPIHSPRAFLDLLD